MGISLHSVIMILVGFPRVKRENRNYRLHELERLSIDILEALELVDKAKGNPAVLNLDLDGAPCSTKFVFASELWNRVFGVNFTNEFEM